MVHYGSEPEDYLNDVLTRKAVAVIGRSAAAGQPFFLYVLPFTPHSPAVAAPRHKGLFGDAELPRPPSFDEADVSDKPAFIRGSRRSTGRVAWLEQEYRRRLRIAAGDRRHGREHRRGAGDDGALDHTYVVYTSDNGFHMGEHRLIAGKDTPYEEDIRVPMVMRGPGVPVGARIEAMALTSISRRPSPRSRGSSRPTSWMAARSCRCSRTRPALAGELPDRAPQARGAATSASKFSGLTPEQLDRRPSSMACARAEWSTSSTAAASASCTIWQKILTS